MNGKAGLAQSRGADEGMERWASRYKVDVGTRLKSKTDRWGSTTASILGDGSCSCTTPPNSLRLHQIATEVPPQLSCWHWSDRALGWGYSRAICVKPPQMSKFVTTFLRLRKRNVSAKNVKLGRRSSKEKNTISDDRVRIVSPSISNSSVIGDNNDLLNSASVGPKPWCKFYQRRG